MKRSGRMCFDFGICFEVVIGFVLICASTVSQGVTSPTDVAAINSLYASLGSPVLPGWVASAGDPCGENWQGVVCQASDIVSIVLNGANLGGELGTQLASFHSIITIDLSSNHIGGNIPSNLPVTMQNFFLSANNFTGIIPPSLSSLTLLTAMSLNGNFLSGEIPDSFEFLTGLINLDLSNNNFSGQLPPSFANLIQLTTLKLQENHISGTVDVLQDLPLINLNIENNLFSGPIPDKMLAIPNFSKDGNLFIDSTAPIPAPLSPLTPPPFPSILGTPPPPSSPSPPSSGKSPGRQSEGPSSPEESRAGGKKFLTTKRVVWISIAGVLLFIILAIALLLFIPRCNNRRREEAGRSSKLHQVGAYKGNRENQREHAPPLALPTNETAKGAKEAMAPPKEEKLKPQPTNEIIRPRIPQPKHERIMPRMPKQDDYGIDMRRLDSFDMSAPPPPPPPPPPAPVSAPPTPPLPPLFSVEKVTVTPIVQAEASFQRPPTKAQNQQVSARSFTIASLQQYTNSFSQDNLIGGGMLGNVYRAELSNGKLLAVKKLDKKVSSQQKDEEFLELVNNIDRIRHANVVELVGYCAEHGQRLLIYEYCNNGTLQDVLHSSDDELKKNLSWNTRIRMALGAARALEYLHEVCHPPIVHRNFKSANILLDEDLDVRVSDCGLAPLISSGSVSQLSGHLLTAYGYGAPEFETGIYTDQSDVFSFGVVMLELLTGRKSHDRTRNRGEQFLVRWAIPQLHDIDALSKMVDPSLHGQYPAKSLSHFADIISRCVQTQPEFRPPMSEVVQDLTDMIRRERPGSRPSNESIGD
ncbi:STRUBBELIG-receptor family 3 [Euphorbia peplus]|nr:STRUBBELIG-receptor family 3 [Euphorbia peplus]